MMSNAKIHFLPSISFALHGAVMCISCLVACKDQLVLTGLWFLFETSAPGGFAEGDPHLLSPQS